MAPSKGRKCSRGHTFTGNEPCPQCWPGYRTFAFRAKVWLYQGNGGWHFVTLPKKTSETIKRRFAEFKRGWGSLPITATIGNTSWKTSIFPDKKADAYLLAIKAEIRTSEKVVIGKIITMKLTVRE